MESFENRILQGDAIIELGKLASSSVDMVMTSPPYWALRDYKADNQLGREKTYNEYLDRLLSVFDEVKRVLKEDGSCWVNLGDKYAFRGENVGEKSLHSESSKPPNLRERTIENAASPLKCLCMIPERFALGMIERGWILRNQIIWYKPNCKPSGPHNCFTVDFEKIFFFVKNDSYFFERQFENLKESYKGFCDTTNANSNPNKWTKGTIPDSRDPHPNRKYVRCVWKIDVNRCSAAHPAMFPEALCEIPIRAGCPAGGVVLDPFFGSGTTGIAALKQGKKFLGIELNPNYIEVAKEKIDKFSNDSWTKVEVMTHLGKIEFQPSQQYFNFLNQS